ncbi:hypothetical protein CG51_05215 [Haematobacter missouriensis]|uniref:hypothetical protein n=1 Tax=Haematobacter missouriensis TaxID=366616 RepID=UPI0004E8FC5C|nr:hypothetical protein [Haematobacter missouriensis]KFI34287.1 hypothetical protein CG51_05215 [Haematobacter missouriensis]
MTDKSDLDAMRRERDDALDERDAMRARVKDLEEALTTVAELSDDLAMRALARAALTPKGGSDE